MGKVYLLILGFCSGHWEELASVLASLCPPSYPNIIASVSTCLSPLCYILMYIIGIMFLPHALSHWFTSVRSWMQAVVKLERSEPTSSTTGKLGKAKELQMSNSNLKRNRQCSCSALQFNFPGSFFPCRSPGGLGCLCVVSSVDLSLCAPTRRPPSNIFQ